MKYSVQAFNAGTFWVPGPEVYWMEGWNQREEMNVILYLVRGGGENILISTGPPQDISILNKAWLDFFGYPEAQIVRSVEQLPQNILRSQGLTPEDITTVIVTPLQAYATANIHLFKKYEYLHFPPWLDRRSSSAFLSPACSPSSSNSTRSQSLSTRSFLRILRPASRAEVPSVNLAEFVAADRSWFATEFA